MTVANSVVTTTRTINPAFFKEVKEVHRTLWLQLDRLRGRAAAPFGSADKVDRLISELYDLQDSLALHFSLEEAYGYFAEPLSVAPRLSEQADKLHAQHDALFLEMVSVAEEAFELFADHNVSPRQVARILQRFVEFDEQFMMHERAENELILAAFDDDLGSGD